MKEIPIDLMGVHELTEEFLHYTEKAFTSVKNALPSLNEAISIVINAVKNGGRVFYIGAGTSGRIGILDASEIEPTFSRNDVFVPIIAGDLDSFFNAKENLEDNEELGKSDLDQYKPTYKDVVIGISASGKTPYVLGALRFAKEHKVRTILLTNNNVKYDFVDKVVFLDTGEEFIIGSTRLSAGTAQKIALNMISTITMVKLGYTYDRLMVAVKPTNQKLINRAAIIVSEITGAPFDIAYKIVEEVKDARIASLMSKKGLSVDEALRLLKAHNYNFRSAYES